MNICQNKTLPTPAFIIFLKDHFQDWDYSGYRLHVETYFYINMSAHWSLHLNFLYSTTPFQIISQQLLLTFHISADVAEHIIPT